MKKPILKCNMMFQKTQEYNVEDTRFTKVKIWLMHLGINHNGSSFSKEVVERAIPTLANTPILAYVENNDGIKDFSDHRMRIEYTDDLGKKYIYDGHAYGTIPEKNNAHFETRLCDDGVEREFLVVDGILWNKLADGVDILKRDLWKSQSMELSDDENDYFGEYDTNNIYHFKKFKFYGACFLGNKYQPAMQNSTIELAFSKTNEIIKKQMSIFNKFLATQNKGGISVEKEQNNIEESKNVIQEKEVNLKKENSENYENSLTEESKDINVDFNSMKYHIEIKEKENKIKELQLHIHSLEVEKEKITKEFNDFKNLVEFKEKKELITEYDKILKNDTRFQAFKNNDNNCLTNIAVSDLKKELDSYVGALYKKNFSIRNNVNQLENSNGIVYFNNDERNTSNSPYGDILDIL